MADEKETKMTVDELNATVAKAVKEAISAMPQPDVKTLVAEEIAKATPKPVSDPKTEVTHDPNKAMFSGETKAEEFVKRGGYDEKNVKLAAGLFLKDLIQVASPQGRMSDRLKTWTNFRRTDEGRKVWLNETDDEQGAYLVPADIGTHLQAASLEGAIVRNQGARIYPLRGNRITISADVDETHAGTFYGGVTLYRPAEAGLKHESKPNYRQIALTLHKLVGVCRVTDELLEDSALALEADLSRKFGQAIAFQEDDDFINGTGAGMAQGILGAGCLITVPAQPLQPAATIVYQNIVNMWARLWTGAQRPVWLANKTVFPQLAGLSLAVGAGGGPVWMPAGGISGAPYQTLLGLPVIYTEKCPTLGLLGDIVLCDWSQYAIAEKAGGIQTAASMHLYFLYDEQVFRFVLRYDGQPTWRVPLQPHNGATLSPFVALAARP